MITKQLFASIQNENTRILYSELTESELGNAPQKVKDFSNGLPKEMIEYIEITPESIELADRYIPKM